MYKRHENLNFYQTASASGDFISLTHNQGFATGPHWYISQCA